MQCAEKLKILAILLEVRMSLFLYYQFIFMLSISFLKIHHLNSLDSALPIVAWSSMIVSQQKLALLSLIRGKGPSIKYVHKEGGGVYAKAYIHCFGDVILLLKYIQGWTGDQTLDLFKRTYFMDGPKSSCS